MSTTTLPVPSPLPSSLLPPLEEEALLLEEEEVELEEDDVLLEQLGPAAAPEADDAERLRALGVARFRRGLATGSSSGHSPSGYNSKIGRLCLLAAGLCGWPSMYDM